MQINRLDDEPAPIARGYAPDHDVAMTHLPPDLRDALRAAAARHDIDAIDDITDRLAEDFPDRFVRRGACRAEFAAAPRVHTWGTKGAALRMSLGMSEVHAQAGAAA